MDDDLNVSGALGAVFDLVRDLNRRVDARSLSTADARPGARRCCATSTGYSAFCRDEEQASARRRPQALLDQRELARAARDWSASDLLRDDLAALRRRRRGHARRTTLAKRMEKTDG